MCACASLVLPGCPSFLPQAVALKGLVEALLAEGCVVVATSNRAPWELDRHVRGQAAGRSWGPCLLLVGAFWQPHLALPFTRAGDSCYL